MNAHKRPGLLLVGVLVLLAFLWLPYSVYAYNKVQGQVIDSKNKDPWQYGGEVWVYVVSTGDVCATGRLNATDGKFNLNLDGTSNALGYSPVVNCTQAVYNGETIEILIDFICSYAGPYGGSTCNPPNGYPATKSVQFTQNGIPITYNAGYIETGTGPTAVTLETFSGAAFTGVNRLIIALGGLLGLGLLGLVFPVIARRR